MALPLASAGDTGLIVLILAAWAALVGVNLLKGKWGLAVIALFLGWLSLIGVFRLARPNSVWYRRFYDEEKQRASVARFARFECKLCKERFREKDAVREHIATVHHYLDERAQRKALRGRGRGIL